MEADSKAQQMGMRICRIAMDVCGVSRSADAWTRPHILHHISHCSSADNDTHMHGALFLVAQPAKFRHPATQKKALREKHRDVFAEIITMCKMYIQRQAATIYQV